MSSNTPYFTVKSVLRIVLALLALSCRPDAFAGTNKDPFEILAAVGLEGDIKAGCTLRADSWGGDLPADGSRRIEHTLFRGNDYRFYAYTPTKGAKISFHIQDRDGALVESRAWQKEKDDLCFAGAEISPKTTGAYYLVVKIERTDAERTEWSLVYAYK